MLPSLVPKHLLLNRAFQFVIAFLFVGSWSFLAYTEELFMRPGGQLPAFASLILFTGFWLQPGALWLYLLTVPHPVAMPGMIGIQIVSLFANYSLLALTAQRWPRFGRVIACCMLCLAILTLGAAVHSYHIFKSIDWTPPS